MNHDRHEHDLGLGHDLARRIGRRHMLGLFAGAGLLTLAGCAAASSPNGSPGTTSSGSPGDRPGKPPGGPNGAGQQAAAGEIPQETAGPYPADGSNGPNALTESGIVRRDLRASFGSLSGTAQGVPLTIELTITDAADNGTVLPGAAVYLWHCDREGRYSLYDIEDQNYLRGVQEADSSGKVSFVSIFPGAYTGRWPHIHFEVYPDLASATTSGNAITTSQIALPQATCEQVYATDGYRDSVANLERTSLESDNVFGDGYSTQLATISGRPSGGLTATLTVPVAA
jgi:protocatechuate 3,4-dioxygenase beta subunit